MATKLVLHQRNHCICMLKQLHHHSIAMKCNSLS
jgi:hypothetical protein